MESAALPEPPLVTPASPGQMGNTFFVNPFIGTGGHGHTYPGAVVPFGLVQLSPDTRLEGWDGCSGYHYSDSMIYGFSHSHLQGTGVSDLGDFLFMPTNGKLRKADRWNDAYKSHFSHDTEIAEPGFYQVMLDDYGIKAELTATERVGIHRYTFQPGDTCRFFFDFMHRDKIGMYDIRMIGDTAVYGFRTSSAWATNQHAYFYAVFSRPLTEPEQMMLSSETKDPVTGVRRIDMEQVQVFSSQIIPDPKDHTLLIKVGYSGTDVDGAMKNLYAEAPHWDFDQYRADADKKWENKLAKIAPPLESDDPFKTKFYTALYHCYTVPNLWSDVDGRYRTMNNSIAKVDYNRYTIFSLWDTFRAYHPLMSELEPEVARDWVRTFLDMYKERQELPVWELHANETYCMIGYHSVPVILDAYRKGIITEQKELALEAMIATSNGPQQEKKDYVKWGYVPGDAHSESVSKTLEFAFDDWCIAEMAMLCNKPDIAAIYYDRAQSWKNVFDPVTHFMRPRRNGGFPEPFDPYQVNFNYTEANAFQYALFVPHDMGSLARLMGGTEAYAQFVDHIFQANSQTTGREQADITGLIGQYAHGNEPSHQMSFLYQHFAPEKSAQLMTQIFADLYGTKDDGLCGNEDCGQMSAWLVAAASGKYPICPGNKEHYMTIAECASGEKIPFTQMTAPAITPVPIIQGPPSSFVKTAKVTLFNAEPTAKMKVTVQYEKKKSSFDYTAPFDITGSCTITAIAVMNGKESKPAVASYFIRDNKVKVVSSSSFDAQYTGGGADALIDGIRGGSDFRTGTWQGFAGKDVEVIIDFGEKKRMHDVFVSCLQDTKSWIWYPSQIDFYASADGITYQSLGSAKETKRQKEEGASIYSFGMATGNAKPTYRYLKIVAHPAFDRIPDWHLGAGGKPWIFMDEIYIRD
ncbi:MAG: hypothetical protein RLZZ77_785 [Bacteroidota bacterium]